MGCDIHAHIEYDDFKMQDGTYWISHFSSPYLGRNYTMFALMAGVRYDSRIDKGFVPLFSPRGIPDKLSWETQGAYFDHVNDEYADKGWEGYVTKQSAENWVSSGYSYWANEEHTLVSNPDWHSASYLTTRELEKVIYTYEGILFPEESWFQFKPPSKQPVPDNAIVKELQNKYDPTRTEYYVQVGESKVYSAPKTYLATLAAMKELERGMEEDQGVRLVFWFDN